MKNDGEKNRLFFLRDAGFYFSLGAFLVLGIFVYSLYSLAAWTNPTAAPPANNVAEPINAGSLTQTKLGTFKLGTTTAPASIANLFVYNGRVAIATSTLGSRLTIDDPSGPNVGVINVGGNRIVGLSLTPLANDESASKYYVDSSVAAGSGFWADRGSNNISNTNTGKIGIGTISPQVTLDINQGSYGLPATSGTAQTFGALRLRAETGGNVVLDMGVNGATGTWLQTTNRGDLSQEYPLLLNPNGGNVSVGANIYAPSIDNFKQNGSLLNKVITSDTTQIVQSPISGFLWHDIIAFNKNATPTFETSVDGSIWAAGTLDKRLFSQIENQAITIIDPATTKAVRWTWSSGVSCSAISWLVLGVTWWSTSPNVTVLAETSTDGSTWTTIHNSTGTYNSTPVWFYLSSIACNPYLRVTITSNNAGLFRLSSMRLLSYRWGDQGLGSENSFPYAWDANRNIAFGASAVANGVVTIGSNTTVASGGLYFGTDSNLYRSGANQLKTDDSLVVSGNVGIATSSSATYRLDINGSVRLSGDIKIGGKIDIGPGDVAEEFYTDRDYPAGTVLVMDDNGYKSARACTKKYDSTVIGVISEDPGLVIGKINGKYKAPVALTGVIKVRVNNAGGKIHQGDLLTTSAITGEAMRADEPKIGTIIGKALESDSGKEWVMALVNLK
jgi:hypothetical protein